MCFEPASTAPSFPGAAVPASVERIVLASEVPFAAVHATPMRPTSGAGVLVVPDARGLHRYYETLALRLAEAGFETVAVDLYGRTAGVGARGAGFASAEHSARLRWTGVQRDLGAAAAVLRRHDARRPVCLLGFCLGGRIALLGAAVPALDVHAAVAFYPQTRGPARSDLPAPEDVVDDLRGPVLTIFGGADELIPRADMHDWRAALAARDAGHDVVIYPGAPHSFFDRRATAFAEPTADAASRVATFLGATAASRR